MTSNTDTKVMQQLQHYNYQPDYILQMLRNIQLSQHFISMQDIRELSDALNMPSMKIVAIIDFYRFLHKEPTGDFEIYFSDNITDQMQGNLQLLELFCDLLGVKPGTSREDFRVFVDKTSCTGLCEQGPAILVNGLALVRLDTEIVHEMAQLIDQGVVISEWPQDWFLVENNIQQKGPLLSSNTNPGAAIKIALNSGPEAVIDELKKSGLRGCGGAGFATHMKWQMAIATEETTRYIVCNADEGEPGTFKDRVLLNEYADNLLEGMTVCAATIGAEKGFIYLRHEYQFLREQLLQNIEQRCQANLLGKNILGEENFDFEIEIYMGAGSYVCGEESALIESLEGKRGVPRIRPPFPVTSGYKGKPTVVNNVETFSYAAQIIEHGASFFNKGSSNNGWKLISISGDCKRPGIYEIQLGTRISDLLKKCGATETQAIQVGGAGGTLVSPEQFFEEISFDGLNTGGSFIIFNRNRDMMDRAVNFTHFFTHESCGFCTPCRVGTKLMSQMADKAATGLIAHLDMEQIHKLHNVMTKVSHCGLGQRAAVPMLETCQKFPESFRNRMTGNEYQPAFDVEAAVKRAKEIIADQEQWN